MSDKVPGGNARENRRSQLSDLLHLIQCPRCGGPLEGLEGPRPLCRNAACVYATEGFPVAGGQPVLIDFENSVFARPAYLDGRGSVARRDDTGASLRTRMRQALYRANTHSVEKSREMLARLASSPHRPKLLIIGGGARGAGSDALYASDAIDLIGIDVYASPNTLLVGDGHQLPFKDASFDAVWIQAVLEHVLEPQIVVSEIFRVLRPQGLVFAATPFMQQVHEGAYDFTRYTLSGHRWLFRRFEQIDSGTGFGAGTSAAWSIRYLLRALGLGNKLATVLMFPLFWLTYLDHITQKRPNADAANGVYFFGFKSDRTLAPKDIVAFYEAQQ